ncbi:O-methyltransferase ZRP4 [Citrus sinensis]|nr:O-methyltransferase ZRP4 [Citrus sinensis]
MNLIDGEHDTELLEAQAHVWNHIFNFINSMSLKCAVELGIPDIINKHGKPMTLNELVSALTINPSKTRCVYRLMRILIHSGFFAQQTLNSSRNNNDEEQGYVLKNASKLLLKDNPLSVTPFLQAMLDPILLSPWLKLSTSFQNDDPTPFDTLHGKSFWDYAGDEPKINNFFNEAMASDARLATRVCTDFDLPHVVNGLESDLANLKYVGGDMFEAIPPADAVLLKWILHDWDGEECVKILKKCKEAFRAMIRKGRSLVTVRDLTSVVVTDRDLTSVVVTDRDLTSVVVTDLDLTGVVVADRDLGA